MNITKQFLYQIMLWMRNSAAGAKIYVLLDDIGIRIMISRCFNFWKAVMEKRHPGKEVKDSRDYFVSHKSEILRVISLFDDEESKNIYKAMWRFRCTSNYSSLPQNHYKTQYFDNDLFRYDRQDTEVFVDCGAFDGDTVRGFKRLMRKKGIDQYRIVAFEPDAENFKNLRRNQPDITAVSAGCWSSEGILQFCSDADASKICKSARTGTSVIRVKCIDRVRECHDASFIKMDIEGAEQKALLGAVETIRRNRPRLAVCIYHSDEDMVKIPLLIHEICPDYKLYVRQHSNSRAETVLYADK